MPELPEVENVAQGLRQRVQGRRISEVKVRNASVIKGSAKDFARRVSGCTIGQVHRKGKVIAVELEDGGAPEFLVVRLGMTGQVTLAPHAKTPEKHTHVFLSLDEGQDELRFRDSRRFGNLRVLKRGELEKMLGELGPDAQRISEEDFFQATRGRHGAVKSWLMNQHVLSGVGNVYADEALFEARLNPLKHPGQLSRDEAGRLYSAVNKILERAVSLQGTTFRDFVDLDGKPGKFSIELKVYQREGEPCKRCGTPIKRIVHAGRSCHFCPYCQPARRHAARQKNLERGKLRKSSK
jgi:formamidopyrimidine-DNA glycosylase